MVRIPELPTVFHRIAWQRWKTVDPLRLLAEGVVPKVCWFHDEGLLVPWEHSSASQHPKASEPWKRYLAKLGRTVPDVLISKGIGMNAGVFWPAGSKTLFILGSNNYKLELTWTLNRNSE